MRIIKLHCRFLLQIFSEDAKREEHYDIAQILRTEVVEEIRDKIVLKSKPLVAPSAGRMVKEKIVDVANNAVKKCQAQKSGDIADEKRGQDDLSSGAPPTLPNFVNCIGYPGNQSNRERLKKTGYVLKKKYRHTAAKIAAFFPHSALLHHACISTPCQ